MSVDTKYGEAIFKQTQEVAEMFKAAMPKITTNKSNRQNHAFVSKNVTVENTDINRNWCRKQRHILKQNIKPTVHARTIVLPNSRAASDELNRPTDFRAAKHSRATDIHKSCCRTQSCCRS